MKTDQSRAMFALKLDNNGNFIWAKQSSGGTARGFSITADNMGNAYVTGFFADTCDFDPGTGVYEFIDRGGSDIFYLKLDNKGKFVWAKQIGESGSDYDDAPGSYNSDRLNFLNKKNRYAACTNTAPAM